MSERLSDKTVVEWYGALMGMRPEDGSPIDKLIQYHVQARAEVVAKGERIAALEAELARLKPSGQVAHDQTMVFGALMHVNPKAGLLGFDRATVDAALVSLAAKAQGYEAAVADNAARQRVGAMMANACFNLSQREHLRPDERQTLDELRRAWDALGAHPGAALLEEHRKEAEAFTARLAALRDHAQMLYESAPPTNSRTSREQVEQWEKAKRIHHELMAAPDAGAELLTELNDHRRNIEVLRDELGAKDDEHVVNALHRRSERLRAAIKNLAAYIRSRAGHEENCRGWRKPVKDKRAPVWQRRGEWMKLDACTCGPGELLRMADGALK